LARGQQDIVLGFLIAMCPYALKTAHPKKN